ncbi:hypothetical protein PUNSTDRAFT_117058 [Punctularia strigosozonata HHB-11173 SS5]|uniref:uncharacterized protein n=1 Tax=Punctularia strigosozonata (strain HHB-11173) TaxID=741275 RepID=UPI0004417B32|nr:uncharacterized protein PUNSTDRAFT_117058 [Punctularia strigosozonata HHB-11173 SS5]EIN13145.1 hypothetical protein PUNSTDRAFT_117058 [Punctularia strigosozonata HHB-11173 SS5]
MTSLDIERWINRGGIRREIPPRALAAICEDAVSSLLSSPFTATTMRDVEFVAPAWEKRVRSALASRLEDAGAASSRNVPEVLHEWLSKEVHDNIAELRCTGIVFGSLTDGDDDAKAYDDHYRHPYPTFRHYQKETSYARLVAPFRGREHLRWVPLSVMDKGYHPIVLPFGRRREHIGLFRQLDSEDENDGVLLTLSEDLRPVETACTNDIKNEETGLHVLASTSADAAIYWVTRTTKLVHALRPEQKRRIAVSCAKGAFIACTCGFEWDD